ncbi:MAG: putative molybdenum cofactor guanylyltransferase [Chroococcopsis gigantea SAG 12.99]|jgi:molybdopterin-guanine dinucleotide biosynthesis protein A|nr:putative molybdenum cofactor guanylyltransferase [Chroococcopsis gigantea SAG 12.99]
MIYPKNEITAIILAGGRSSRMGQDKALISVAAVPLLRQICDLASCCAVKVYVVTPWHDRYQSLITPSCVLLDENPPFTGPLVSFSKVLPLVRTSWVLLLACDLPFLTPSEVQEWAARLPSLSQETIALVPRLDDRWHPLSAFYRSDCLSSLEDFIRAGGSSFQVWLDRSPVQILPVTNPQVLFNCNTPEDLEIVINAPNNREDNS